MMRQLFSLLAIALVLLLPQHALGFVKCATFSETKTRIFTSLREYQANKYPFDPVTSGWLGSTVKFTDSTRIKVLQKNIFITKDSQHIVKMILNGKHIERVDEGAFLQLDCVHELFLNHNNITKLSKESFQGLYHLENLDLKCNGLADLPDLLFSNVPRLRVLDLSHNQILQVQSLTFQDLVLVEVLYLDHNRLIRLPDTVFQPMASLMTLNLGWNRLRDVEPERWYGLRKLESLSLAGNELDHFVFSSDSVKSLNLSHNTLTELNVEAMHQHMPSLELIDLNDNSLLCDYLKSLDMFKIRLVSGSVSGSSVHGVGCSEVPLFTRTTESSTTTIVATTTEYRSSPNKFYVESMVERKVKESTEQIKDSVTYLNNMVICLFVVLSGFIVFEIVARMNCRRFRGRGEYLDNGDEENLRLFRRP